ncbi:ABC transporter ATP-binding protein [Conexibacter sp. CPCC 206217]|uniref:ABC transporter ATP-binding protein n=1 Tax=Conexibacter sp. CPCC 206217 TaxID=3064574 RepID=UPI002727F070|nr:ABC transporter ATP-binding protein [Conexibacter sp. CPCC 206217]MDO8211031.1 ABC transporter ATP-binding protein [Conexibacter sp. CPCC 206217]
MHDRARDAAVTAPAADASSGEPLLVVDRLVAGYDKSEVLFGVSLHVRPGEVVAVLGHNGAGKTTLLKAICGLLRPRGGEVSFGGERITNRDTASNVEDGLVFSPADAAVFRELPVLDNLALGGFTERDGQARQQRLRDVLELFPILAQRERQVAGTLSGGERRMLSIGIALMSRPRMILLDEPSNGIAPGLVDRIFAQVRELARAEGIAVVLVEQNVRSALRVADRAYFMRSGRMILEEPADVALARGEWWDLF